MSQVILECPLCGKKSLSIVDKKTGYMQCLHCGYSSADKFKGNKTNPEYEALSEDMKKMVIIEDNKIWIPSVLTLPFGIINPVLVDKEMFWSFAPMIEIPENEKQNYPDGHGGYYEKRYDTEKTTLYKYFFDCIKEINQKYGQ
jgi:ribosomal protein L37AE/L43A